MPQPWTKTPTCLLPRSDQRPDKHKFSAPLRPPRFLAAFPEPCRPCDDIHRRIVGTPWHMPDNAPLDVWRTRHRRHHKYPRKFDRQHWPFHCRETCKPQPDGRFVRNPCRALCSEPSILGQSLAGRISHSGHTLLRNCCKRRYRIGTVDAPWFPPKKQVVGK